MSYLELLQIRSPNEIGPPRAWNGLGPCNALSWGTSKIKTGYRHENLKYTVMKHLTKKIKKYSNFQTVTTNNSKRFFRFYIKQYWQFQGVNTKWYYILFQSSCQTIFTLSESYYQTTVYIFSEFISNITDTFRELLPNNTTHFSRHQTILTFPESYWQTIIHFSRTYIKQYEHFQSYWQIILHTFPEFILNNTDIFRELLANNTINFSRFHIIIKQYWHFQRVTTKQYWLIQSSY